MTVISFDEIHPGRDGEDAVDADGKQVTRYTRSFRVVTDNNDQDAASILTYVAEAPVTTSSPLIGSQHPNDILAFCQRRRAHNEMFSKRVWIATYMYSTEREYNENPLDEPVDIEWSTNQYTRPFFLDKAGKAILNGAGIAFSPAIEGDDSRWGAVIRSNVSEVPSWLGSYRDAINTTAFVLDGYTVGVRMAKVSQMSIGKRQERNGTAFRVLTITIQLDEDTWIKRTLNDSFYEIANVGAEPTLIKDGEGVDVTEPWPILPADDPATPGKKIAKPTPSNVNFVSSSIYKELLFAGILPGTIPIAPPSQ